MDSHFGAVGAADALGGEDRVVAHVALDDLLHVLAVHHAGQVLDGLPLRNHAHLARRRGGSLRRVRHADPLVHQLVRLDVGHPVLAARDAPGADAVAEGHHVQVRAVNARVRHVRRDDLAQKLHLGEHVVDVLHVEAELFGHFGSRRGQQRDHLHLFLGVHLAHEVGRDEGIRRHLHVHLCALDVNGVQFRQRAAENFFHFCLLLFNRHCQSVLSVLHGVPAGRESAGKFRARRECFPLAAAGEI